MAKILQFDMSRTMAIFFLAVGVLWIAIFLAGEGTILLIGPSSVSLISGVLLILRVGGRYLKSLVAAAGLYNLILFLYQAYAAFGLFSVGIFTQGLASIVGYSAGAFICLIVLLTIYSRFEEIGSVETQDAEDSRKYTR